MTPDEFRHRREALGLTVDTFAELLNVTAADVVRCERTFQLDPFVLALSMAYAELQLEDRGKERNRSVRRWDAPGTSAALAAVPL